MSSEVAVVPSGARLARQAVVIGAGIGGLAAAAALADWCEHVILIEQDAPGEGVPRPGTPQAGHCHGLLGGGLVALSELFPGLDRELQRAGAVPVHLSQDLREELPDGTPMPQRDLGFMGYTFSRPLLEAALNRCLQQRENITVRHSTEALEILADCERRRVTGVRCVASDGAQQAGAAAQTLAADIVVEATGRGSLTQALLESLGCGPVPLTTIGIDLSYTTAVIAVKNVCPVDWKAVVTVNRPPSSRRAVMLRIEADRWMLSVAGQAGERPGGDWAAMLTHLTKLPTTTIHRAVSGAEPIGEPVRFGLTQSIWRHFERVDRWPEGLIPVGDAMCRVNPVYGQGMTVAAKQGAQLHRLLGRAASQPDPIRGLARGYLAAAKQLIETPWTMAAMPDLALPHARGERPPGLERSLRFSMALRQLAVRDAEVHRRVAEVWHLLRPRSVLDDPLLVQRVEAQMEEAELSAVPRAADVTRSRRALSSIRTT